MKLILVEKRIPDRQEWNMSTSSNLKRPKLNRTCRFESKCPLTICRDRGEIRGRGSTFSSRRQKVTIRSLRETFAKLCRRCVAKRPVGRTMFRWWRFEKVSEFCRCQESSFLFSNWKKCDNFEKNAKREMWKILKKN